MIEVIGKKGCSKCTMVKSLLEKRGIPFKYLRVEDNDALRNKVMAENQGMYPMIIRDNEVVRLQDVL